jgi:hypothetical protein
MGCGSSRPAHGNIRRRHHATALARSRSAPGRCKFYGHAGCASTRGAHVSVGSCDMEERRTRGQPAAEIRGCPCAEGLCQLTVPSRPRLGPARAPVRSAEHLPHATGYREGLQCFAHRIPRDCVRSRQRYRGEVANACFDAQIALPYASRPPRKITAARTTAAREGGRKQRLPDASPAPCTAQATGCTAMPLTVVALSVLATCRPAQPMALPQHEPACAHVRSTGRVHWPNHRGPTAAWPATQQHWHWFVIGCVQTP